MNLLNMIYGLDEDTPIEELDDCFEDLNTYIENRNISQERKDAFRVVIKFVKMSKVHN